MGSGLEDLKMTGNMRLPTFLLWSRASRLVLAAFAAVIFFIAGLAESIFHF
jgi:hypothetical protein